MRILLAHPSADLRGADKILSAIEALIGKGHEVHAVVPIAGPMAGALADAKASVAVANVPVARTADLHPVRIAVLLWQLLRGLGSVARAIRAQRPDVLYVNTVLQPSWVVAAKLVRRPVVVHVRDSECRWPSGARRLLYGCLSLADLVICDSEATRTQVLKMVHVPWGRTTVIYDGRNWSDYRTDGKGHGVGTAGGEGPKLTVIGRLSHRNGQDVAIRALAELIGQGCPARLTLVGDACEGDEAVWSELIDLARTLDVLDRTRFTGFQNDFRSILSDTDIAIVPSRIAQFATVAAECMAAGVLTIVSAVEGLTEIVESGRNGMTFRSADHAMLARRCRWVVANPAESAELARRGQRDVNERFGLDHYQREIVEALESVVVDPIRSGKATAVTS